MKVAACYINLGIVADNQGEYEEAKAYYQKALKIKVSKLGEDHPSVRQTKRNLALLPLPKEKLGCWVPC